MTPEEMMLNDLQQEYASLELDERYERLYTGAGLPHRMFAYFHQRLNWLFDFMNRKSTTNRNFNAAESRELLDIIARIKDARKILSAVGVDFEIDPYYSETLDYCLKFLQPSWGSTIPEDFKQIELVQYKPIFLVPENQVYLPGKRITADLDEVGTGAFAIVYSYIDPDYGVRFALKRAKAWLGERDLQRFRREYEILRSLNFPYVLTVYGYNDDRNEYTMEFCDSTLRDFIANHSELSFLARKRVALQFLYGVNYLHQKGCLHRDISYQNILIKEYDLVAVTVKLSDFGLYKDRSSEFTRTDSQVRGTIVDPALESFKHYSVTNEVYAIGYILAYIFTGHYLPAACSGEVGRIVNQCIDPDPVRRYADVRTIIRHIESLGPVVPTRPGEAPA